MKMNQLLIINNIIVITSQKYFDIKQEYKNI